jgi:putative ATP-dependent endonuclease of OLD family
MKLKAVHIQNFRGIKNLELDLDDLVVLIGENNTGKTAILHAIRLCLRDLGPRRRVVFDGFDFHLKDEHAEPSGADPIAITITFAEETAGDWDAARQRRLKDISYVADPISGRGAVALRVSCSYNPTERDFDQTWDFLNEAGQPLPSKSEAHLAVLQREVAFFLLDALRDAGRNFDAKGPFWRPFLKDSQLPPEKKAEIETKLKEVLRSTLTKPHALA